MHHIRNLPLGTGVGFVGEEPLRSVGLEREGGGHPLGHPLAEGGDADLPDEDDGRRDGHRRRGHQSV